jgi:excisionase family DNA binding protein
MPASTSPLNTASPYRTVAEVSGFLRISQRQVRRLIAYGEITVTRFGRAVRIHERDLMAYIGRAGKVA